MLPIPLREVARFCGGSLTGGNSDQTISAVTTDSRAVPEGSLFIALRGEKFDGHDHAAAAAASGAIAVMIEVGRESMALPAGIAVVTVRDTLTGLQSLASGYRDKINPRVVAITGSNGKTTAKEFTRAVLLARHRTHATKGNLNNHIGLPMTMLSHDPTASHGVYELGMNHPGEIAALAAIARPDIAVVTYLGTAHIEFFGTREAIAEEKLSLFAALPGDGVAVINLESPLAELAIERATGRRITTGIGRGDVRAVNPGFTSDGRACFTVLHGDELAEVELAVPGSHMIQNALLALAVGVLEGVPLAEGAAALAGCTPGGGRLNVRDWRGVAIIDDSYNANPDSMKAALDTLKARPAEGRKFAVLGGMGELGAYAVQGHDEVGRHAASLNLEFVIVVGERARGIANSASGSKWFPDHASCAHWLAGELREGDVLLVKGSRGSAMELVLRDLEKEVTV
ncbi:MAG: UDP-N-acetylmuramoyl-tripeptide--D-alanyl-D-alanine ligase [Verrucomicrobiales bacterium]